MAWTTPRTWTSTEVVTASIMNTHVRDNFNETAPAKSSAGAGYNIVANGTNSMAARLVDQDSVTTSETTTSTSFTDLTTSGPSVTVTTGAKALILMTAQVSNSSAGSSCYVDYAVSGATTRSANNTSALRYESGSANDVLKVTHAHLNVGLSVGSNTFKLEYRVDGGTGTFANRFITVVPFS